MARMTDFEAMFCRTRLWRWWARKAIVPRVMAKPIGPTVLEIGCGSGAMAAEVLRLRPTIEHYIATDVDPAMISVAADELAPFGARAEAQVVDAGRLPFDDATFDSVASWLMLHHTIEWEQVLAEAARVLKPGGSLVGFDLPDSRFGRWVHVVTRSEVRMIKPADFSAELDRLGFTEIAVKSTGRGQRGPFLFHATR